MAVTIQGGIVIAACVMVHLTLGTIFTFGNLNPYITSYIRKHATPSDLDYSTSVWINSLAAMFQGVSMYFGGVVERRLNNPRITVLMGAWFQSFGIFLTYFTVQHSFALTMLTYGVMFGLGIGFAYAIPLGVAMRIQTAYVNPHNLTPDITDKGEKYFSQDEVLDRVPKLFLLLGGCYATMQFIGLFVSAVPPGSEPKPTAKVELNDVKVSSVRDGAKEEGVQHDYENVPNDADKGADNDVHSAAEAGTKREDETEKPPATDEVVITNHLADEIAQAGESPTPPLTPPPIVGNLTAKQMLRCGRFYILWCMFLAIGQGINFVGALYKAYGQTFIDNDRFLAWVGTLSAVCNASGRIFWGFIADRFSFPVSFMCFFTSFTVLMLTLRLTSLGGQWMFLVWVGLLFFSFSGSFSVMPTACARLFGTKHYSSNYGLVFSSQVITAALSAVLTSQLKNAIGWNGMFCMVAGFSLLSFILTVVGFRKV
ncbi:hypothetical protein BaRGS_00033499 [Batillaria attramentaria]|uniref:Uncharacterized protein n=1 Tax=Batillaria attramentaria TaxID=370345 RepID=A0ABD0JJV3_9CAEN